MGRKRLIRGVFSLRICIIQKDIVLLRSGVDSACLHKTTENQRQDEIQSKENNVAAAYGVVTLPYGVREGINVFLDGFIPTENMRFREMSLSFKISDNTEIIEKKKEEHLFR